MLSLRTENFQQNIKPFYPKFGTEREKKTSKPEPTVNPLAFSESLLGSIYLKFSEILAATALQMFANHPARTKEKEMAISSELSDSDDVSGKSSQALWESCGPWGPLVLYANKNAPIKNFYKVGIGKALYRGAQPGIDRHDRINDAKLKEGLLYLRDKCGVRTIVNLRNETDLKPEAHGLPTDHEEKEAAMIAALNKDAPPDKQLRYIPIPIRSGAAITDEQFPEIQAALGGVSPENPTFVHCKAGIDRAGLFVAMYRAIKGVKPMSIPFQEIYHDMKYCGHNPNGLWQGYIHNIAYHLRTKPIFADYCAKNERHIANTLAGKDDRHPGCKY